MTKKEREKRHLEVAKFLATAQSYRSDGTPIYPTIAETSVRFNYDNHTVYRIKMKYVGKDQGYERSLKAEYAT